MISITRQTFPFEIVLKFPDEIRVRYEEVRAGDAVVVVVVKKVGL